MMTPSEINGLRTRLGVSAVQLALRLGVSVATVYRWENGSHAPSALALRRLLQLARRAERQKPIPSGGSQR